QLDAAIAEFFAGFRGRLALAGVNAALEASGFAFQRVHAFDGLANLVNQALAFEEMEFERTRELRHLNSRARQVVTRAQIRALLGLGNVFQMRGLLQRKEV